MTPAPENPPAFPSVGRDGNWQPYCDGMTLRDWFAGRCLPVMIPTIQKPENVDTIVKAAYQIADAMLAARTQPKPTP